MDDYLNKPIKIDALAAVLVKASKTNAAVARANNSATDLRRAAEITSPQRLAHSRAFEFLAVAQAELDLDPGEVRLHGRHRHSQPAPTR